MNDIYIIGGANIDILGKAKSSLVLQDSNIGKISYSFGGVARNIANNLSIIGNKVKLVTVFANDVFGSLLINDCKKCGIDVSLSLISEIGSSFYLSILDDNSDLLVGVADMEILHMLSISHINNVLLEIEKSDIIVMDTNLDKTTINHVLTNASCPVFVDPISTIKADKIKDELKHIFMLKPNRLEAEKLSGIKIKDKFTAYQTLDYFLSHGINEIVITLGKDGIIASDNKEYLWAYHSYVEVVNANGAGDAFMAGYIDSYKKQLSLKEKLNNAANLARLTLMNEKTVVDGIDITDLKRTLNEKTLVFEDI